jgi:hypothetical protein
MEFSASFWSLVGLWLTAGLATGWLVGCLRSRGR